MCRSAPLGVNYRKLLGAAANPVRSKLCASNINSLRNYPMDTVPYKSARFNQRLCAIKHQKNEFSSGVKLKINKAFFKLFKLIKQPLFCKYLKKLHRSIILLYCNVATLAVDFKNYFMPQICLINRGCNVQLYILLWYDSKVLFYFDTVHLLFSPLFPLRLLSFPPEEA